MKYNRWEMETNETDFDPLIRLYRPKPSQINYNQAVGIENIIGMRRRGDMG